MKNRFLILSTIILLAACQRPPDKEALISQIFKTEKDFEKMAAEKSVAEAFWYYADKYAVINRANDSLIIGKENIRNFYDKKKNKNATVNWTPDFIDVSNDGTLGYTYGKYRWKIKNPDGTISENKGVFHTVWKKQSDNTWRYVWD